MIMPRLGLIDSSPASLVLACSRLMVASLILASVMSGSALAAEDCSNRYKVCNGGCDRPLEGGEVFACKSGCDFRLIACDREPLNAYDAGENRRSLRSAPMKVIIDAPGAPSEAR